jgi:Tfp pilus assembly protein PilN
MKKTDPTSLILNLKHLHNTCLCSRFAVLEWSPLQIRLTRFRVRQGALDMEKSDAVSDIATGLPDVAGLNRLKTHIADLPALDLVLCAPMLRILYQNTNENKGLSLALADETLSLACNGGPLTALAKVHTLQPVIDSFKAADLHLVALYHGMFEWINVPYSLSADLPETWVYKHEHYVAVTETQNHRLQKVQRLSADANAIPEGLSGSRFILSTNGKPADHHRNGFHFDDKINSHPFMHKERILACGTALAYYDKQFKGCNVLQSHSGSVSGQWKLHRFIRMLTLAWALLIVLLLGLFVTGSILDHRHERLYRHYQRHENEIKNLQARKATLAGLDQRMQTAESFFRHRTRTGWILSQIATAIPVDCWLVKISKEQAASDEPSPLILEGFGKNQQSVLDFTRAMQACGAFERIEIRSMETLSAHDLKNQPVTSGLVHYFIIHLEAI